MILPSQYFLKYWVAYQTGPEYERTKNLYLPNLLRVCLQGYGPCRDHNPRDARPSSNWAPPPDQDGKASPQSETARLCCVTSGVEVRSQKEQSLILSR